MRRKSRRKFPKKIKQKLPLIISFIASVTVVVIVLVSQQIQSNQQYAQANETSPSKVPFGCVTTGNCGEKISPNPSKTIVHPSEIPVHTPKGFSFPNFLQILGGLIGHFNPKPIPPNMADLVEPSLPVENAPMNANMNMSNNASDAAAMAIDGNQPLAAAVNAPNGSMIVPSDPVDPNELNNIDPMTYLTTWNFNNLPADQRSQFYQEKKLPNGTTQREYWIDAKVKTITIAKGIMYQAWAFGGQVPGPTLRATEGDTIILHFINKTAMPHSIHFHTYHPGNMDGALPGDQYVQPGQTTTYTFTAAPFGVQLYHCHVEPLAEHIAEGMYGMLIIDPKNDTRPKPDEQLIMMMNGFDLTDEPGSLAFVNADGDNNVYAVNTVAFYYKNHPIPVKVGKLVRIYLVNVTEFDPVNSFHIHGNFFWQYPTGTELKATNFTDTITMGEAERSILDVKFQFPGLWMFHSHKTEFGEKGWMGYFDAK